MTLKVEQSESESNRNTFASCHVGYSKSPFVITVDFESDNENVKR